MAISRRVQTQLSRVVPSGEAQSSSTAASTRGGTYRQPDSGPALVPAPIATSVSPDLPPQVSSNHQNTSSKSVTVTNSTSKGRVWTMEEHERFVQALQLFPAGPWKSIAAVVGTKNPRQTMSHAQKCRQKQERWQRGLKIQSRRSVIATQQPSFIPTPDASSNTNGSQLVQPLPVEEIRCNSVHFSALINEERPVKSHVTSVSVGDAASLTQYWNDVHGGAPGQHQYHHHHHHSLGSVLETVPVFPVFEAFEATEHPAASMWPALIPSSSDGVSSMRLSIPEAGVFADDDGEAREDLLRLFQPRAN